MELWLGLRLVKLVALGWLAAGVALAAGHPRRAERSRSALWIVTPAMWVAWLCGYGLLVVGGRTMLEPFVPASLAASAVALVGALGASARPDPGRFARALGPAGLGAAAAVMVARDQPPAALAVAAVVGALLGGGLVFGLPTVSPDDEPPPIASVRAWFLWIARLEGLSLILLMGVAMPLRRALGVHLDGGTGALGWAHGTLWIVYLVALYTAARALRWSARDVVLAFVASLLPFGTVVFERWRLRDGA